jgi:hypothetical protein
MNTETIFSALLSGLGALTVTVLAVRLIEYFASAKGGVLAALPTTIVPASWGIFYSSNEIDFIPTMLSTIPGMSLNLLYLGLWILVMARINYRYSAWSVLSFCLSIWLLCAISLQLILHRFHFLVVHPLWISACIITPFILGLYLRKKASAKTQRKRIAWRTLIFRSSFSGIAVCLGVLLTATPYKNLSGIVAVFPAIFSAAMFSLYQERGDLPYHAAVGMMIGGTSVSIYAFLFTHFAPLYGFSLAALISWLSACMLIIVPMLVLRSK